MDGVSGTYNDGLTRIDLLVLVDLPLVVFLADHPSAYRTAGLRWGTTTSNSTKAGTTSRFTGG
jgi:hypothetical protein